MLAIWCLHSIWTIMFFSLRRSISYCYSQNVMYGLWLNSCIILKSFLMSFVIRFIYISLSFISWLWRSVGIVALLGSCCSHKRVGPSLLMVDIGPLPLPYWLKAELLMKFLLSIMASSLLLFSIAWYSVLKNRLSCLPELPSPIRSPFRLLNVLFGVVGYCR